MPGRKHRAAALDVVGPSPARGLEGEGGEHRTRWQRGELGSGGVAQGCPRISRCLSGRCIGPAAPESFSDSGAAGGRGKPRAIRSSPSRQNFRWRHRWPLSFRRYPASCLARCRRSRRESPTTVEPPAGAESLRMSCGILLVGDRGPIAPYAKSLHLSAASPEATASGLGRSC